MLMEHYKIKDKKARSIALIIHDIEINKWDRKMYKKTKEVDKEIIDIIKTNKDYNDLIINKANLYFDNLYKKIPEKLQPVIKDN